MAGKSLRDLLALLMVLWIPTSIILFVRHSSQAKDDLRGELLQELRAEQNRLRATVDAVKQLSPQRVPGQQSTPAQPQVYTGQGWPSAPVYDLSGRAFDATDLDASVKNSNWLDVCKHIVDRNRNMLDSCEFMLCHERFCGGLWLLCQCDGAVRPRCPNGVGWREFRLFWLCCRSVAARCRIVTCCM